MMNRHDHCAAAERGQRADDERATIARTHADALAIGHSELVELCAQGFHFMPERLVIQCATGVNDGSAFGPLAGRSGEGFKNIHARRLKFKLAWGKFSRKAATPQRLFASRLCVFAREFIAPYEWQSQRHPANGQKLEMPRLFPPPSRSRAQCR